MNTRTAAAISVGAILGAGLRWLVTLWSGPGGVDAALLTVNVVGAAVLGYLSQYRLRPISEELGALVGVGVCGALTTWSSLALHTASEYRAGTAVAPTLWLGCNLVLGIGVAAAARSISRRQSSTGRSRTRSRTPGS